MALYRKRFSGRALRELDASRFLDDPARKQRYVTFMFDLLAPGYNAFTRIFSFGRDSAWKTSLIEAAAARIDEPGARVADLACGTGDLSLLLRTRLPRACLVPVDISPEMVRIARRLHAEPGRLHFVVGDICAVALRTGSMAGATVGYGLRNLPDLGVGLAEINRVLRCGGVLAVLDFFLPPCGPWRRAFLGYLFLFGSLAGWVWHGDPSTYNYISRSIRRFITLDEFSARLRASGFDVVSVESRLGGRIGLVVARKAARTTGGSSLHERTR